MKEKFLKIADHKDLADFLGLTYPELANLIYKTGSRYKYHQFNIPKKGGGYRDIASPSKKLKAVQSTLKDVLYEIYPTKPSAHGFVIGKSIVTNAEKHLDKKFIFNLDLSDFFGSIHFGRVKNLYKSSPFNFNHAVSTILAQICCFNNALPQGAPTSPIISNMIAWKLDSQLQTLAKATNSTYTRYADDISFSFTCKKLRLPEEVVLLEDDEARPGIALTRIIDDNGFKINYAKVRLCNTSSRMEVTGLTVNEFPNVRRKYVKQLSAMLHAWSKYGYKAAQEEFTNKYRSRHRASDKALSFLHVVKGKLAFLRSVRSGRDAIFSKLAIKFNDLVDDKHKFKIHEPSDPEKNALNSLWVVEICHDLETGEVATYQGSAFDLDDVGILTCAHVVADKGEIYNDIEIYKQFDTTKKYTLVVEKICPHRDVAICSINPKPGIPIPEFKLEKCIKDIEMQESVKLLGFPAYAPGHGYSVVDAKVAKVYTQSAVRKFEIDKQIREGNSGGPIINSDSKVVGIALEGARKSEGHNGCLFISEINEIISSNDYDT